MNDSKQNQSLLLEHVMNPFSATFLKYFSHYPQQVFASK